MGNRSWLYLEHRLSGADNGAEHQKTSADEIAEANNNFPVLWQLLLADGAAGDAIDDQRVFGDAGTDNLASDAHAALARIRQLHAFVEQHPMLHALPQIALQFEALALHLAELIDEVPADSAPRFSANLDELSWLGGETEGEGFIERNRRECNERWAEVRRCIDSGNHPGVDAALGIQRFADWEAWAWQFGFGGLSHPYFDGYEAPRDERFADFEPEEDDDEDGYERPDYDNHLGGELWRFEVDGRWGVMRLVHDEDGDGGASHRTTVVEPAWDDIRYAGGSDPRLLWISQGERSGLLLADAEAPRVLLEPELDEVWDFEDDIATALVGDHIGLLRTDGSWLLEPSVDEVWSFVEGRVRARVGERIGYIDLQGEWAIAPRFEEAEDFTPFGLAPARGDEGGWGLVRADGEWAAPPDFEQLQWRHDWEAFEATRDGKSGLLDAQGRVVIEPVYEQVDLLEEYPIEFLTSEDNDPANERNAEARPKRFAVERADGVCGLVDGRGRVLVPFDYGRFETLEPLTGQERAHAMARRDLVRVASKGGRTAKNAPWLRGIYDVAAGRELVPCRHRTLQPLAWGTQDIGWLVADPMPRSAKVEKGQLAVGVLRGDGTVLHPQANPWIAAAVSVADSWLVAAVRSDLCKRWGAGEPVKAVRNDSGLYVWLHADGREQPHAEHMAARHAAGDLRAAYELACHLRDGEGIEADPREALRWMARAAGVREPGDAPATASSDGLPVAMCELSKMLRWDTAGLGADAQLGRAWLLHAIAHGGADDAATQAQLGYMLCEGEGGERDLEGGVRHYELAAEKNNTMALYNLGLAYKLGEPGEPDLARAIGYFRRGHEAGDTAATMQLGRTLCLHAGALAEQGHGEAEVNVLHAEALYARQKVAEDSTQREQGWACYELGWMRFRGQGAPEDAAAAERWLLAGAALDDCEENLESQRACTEVLAETFYGDPDSPLFDEDKAREWTQRLQALPATTPDAPA
ncbi:SEL1-like repeat protein [Variovorax paradoxus]|uniref:Sel1 domain protein repeat-containing protein n=1 Tax=Variovorax paradoxus (strain EPS) TaxID=595537 RepID=E6UXU9_VARPE|nr:WG repeat-containing protein [Variovorax paradoxus]ADU34293.1 Sel1 domain protein repeat-containing protein [Variovorax paradoxus EPS]